MSNMYTYDSITDSIFIHPMPTVAVMVISNNNRYPDTMEDDRDIKMAKIEKRRKVWAEKVIREKVHLISLVVLLLFGILV